MNMYEEISNNMLAIDNIDLNHNYKYYMRVMDGSNTYVSDYIDIEDFCEVYELIVLEHNKTPLYNGDLCRDILGSIKDLFDYDLTNTLYEYCCGGEDYYQTDYDEIEARISHDCNISFSLEEFRHYLKDENDELDENDDIDIALTKFILSKKNGVAYCYTEIHGASQGDWALCYYPKDTDEEVMQILKAAFFNLGDEVFICPWHDVDDGYFNYIYVSYPLNRDYLEFVMNETGCKRDEVYIECFDGYVKVPQYRHLEFK